MKRLFYLCAALLCLSLAFHFGYTTAKAQVAGTVECVGFEQNAGTAVINHHLIFINNSNPPSHEDLGPLPTAARAVACGLTGVITADGQVWQCFGPGSWRNFGQFDFSGNPTPALQESWGQLKSRYAPSHAPTSSTPTNR